MASRRRSSRWLVLFAPTAWLAYACVPPGTDSTGGGGNATQAITGDGGSEEGGVIGGGCATDPDTGATLCLAVSACPDVVVDQASLPGCGFRVRGGTFDLQCVCQNYLCPLGTPTTCVQAAELLQNQSAFLVCAQVGDNRCTQLAATQTERPGCDTSCASGCGGDALCRQSCGC